VTVVPGGSDLDAALRAVVEDLARVGRRGYVIPGGGSTALGALGYVACADELLAQAFDRSVRVDHLVCASGSGGTHAGLAVGLWGHRAAVRLTGISVRRPRPDQELIVRRLAAETVRALGLDERVPDDQVSVLDDWVGPGYSLPTPAMVEAVRMVAATEGILLDPVYTGKAMAGLIALIRRGTFANTETVVFLHTGGVPALYAYQMVLART